MTAQGHVCTLANDRAEGLKAAAHQAFDLILMDVNMPIMDGLTATRLLRARPGPNMTTPLAILSASARHEDHEIGLAAGADAYLNKPIDFEALAALFKRAAPLQRDVAQSRAARSDGPPDHSGPMSRVDSA